MEIKANKKVTFAQDIEESIGEVSLSSVTGSYANFLSYRAKGLQPFSMQNNSIRNNLLPEGKYEASNSIKLTD